MNHQKSWASFNSKSDKPITDFENELLHAFMGFVTAFVWCEFFAMLAMSF